MYDEVSDQIKVCKDALITLSEKSQDYIDLHDAYLWNNVKDATLLKDKIKEKIVRVTNEN